MYLDGNFRFLFSQKFYNYCGYTSINLEYYTKIQYSKTIYKLEKKIHIVDTYQDHKLHDLTCYVREQPGSVTPKYELKS